MAWAKAHGLELELSREWARTSAVTLNFHPYRRTPSGVTVAAALAESGAYHSQFESGVSNGKLDPSATGERAQWEGLLFERAYAQSPADERPKYGALNLARHINGGAPRFGCCHLRLRPALRDRCTFTWGDSHTSPTHVGTVDELDDVLVQAQRSAMVGEGPFGALSRGVAQLASTQGDWSRELDTYVEAQVHGPVSLARDVDAVVADGSLCGTDLEVELESLSSTFGVPLRWVPGPRLDPTCVPPDFRGPRLLEFAAHVRRRDELIDAASLAAIDAAISTDPARWRVFGNRDEGLQLVKQLWHALVAFGTLG